MKQVFQKEQTVTFKQDMIALEHKHSIKRKNYLELKEWQSQQKILAEIKMKP